MLDVSSRSASKQAVDRIIEEWGAIDILVNNAGVASARSRDGDTISTEEEWDFVLGVNLNGVVNCTDAVLHHMANARYGKIINIASTAGKPGDPLQAKPITVEFGDQVPLGGSAYAASKAAVIRHSQIVASSAAPFNINVNTVCPSRLITPMGIQIAQSLIAQQPEKDESDLVGLRREVVLLNNRFNRELEPADIANMVAFLASDDARNITGQSINVDGGFKML